MLAETVSRKSGCRAAIDVAEPASRSYYTGFFFSVYGETGGVPIAGGGRYDDLYGAFGAPPGGGFRGRRRGGRGRGAVRPPITVAFPKGRIAAPLAKLLSRKPLEISPFTGRGLVVDVPGKNLRFLVLKDFDVPTYVRRGAAEIGIAGSDVLLETECDSAAAAGVPFGRCRFSLPRAGGRRPAVPGRPGGPRRDEVRAADPRPLRPKQWPPTSFRSRARSRSRRG